MPTLTTGKIAEVMFDQAIETFAHQTDLLKMVSVEEPDPGMLQNSGNVIWRPRDQHAPVLDGWDLSGQEQEIIEEEVPFFLEQPKNDFVKQRIDDMRDLRFWERRGKQSGLQQATDLNRRLALALTTQGSLFYESNATSGYDFIAEGAAQLDERQLYNDTRCFILNDRTNLKFGKDLANRDLLGANRPEVAYARNQIGSNVAGFDVYTGSYLPNLTGGANPATTVTADVSERPEAGAVDPSTGTVTNIDARVGTILVTDSSGYAVGDKVTFSNTAVPVEAIGLGDKNTTGQPMTFTIITIPNATTITVYPKPIALDDPALSVTEKAYANTDTQIVTGATVDRLNITAPSTKVNLYFMKNAITLMSGKLPAELFSKYPGFKVISAQIPDSRVYMFMVYDGRIDDLTFRYRLTTWSGITVERPEACGVALSI